MFYMASSDLELIVDVKKCVICRDLGGKPITNVTSSILVSQVKVFDNDCLLNLELKKTLLEKGKAFLAKRLREDSFVIHKPCHDRFNESKRTRTLSTKTRKSKEEEPSRGNRSQ